MFKKGIALTLAAVLCLSLSIGGLSVRAEDARDPSAPTSESIAPAAETTAVSKDPSVPTDKAVPAGDGAADSARPVQKTLLQRFLECQSIGSMKKLFTENTAAVKAMARADLNKIISHHNKLAEKEKAEPVALLELPVPEPVDPSAPTVPEIKADPEAVDPSDPAPVPEEPADPSDPTVSSETTGPSDPADPSAPTVPEETPVLLGEDLLAALLAQPDLQALTAAYDALTEEQLASLTEEQLAQVDHARQMFQARAIYERFAACTTMPEFDSIRLTEEETALMAQFFQENPEEKAVILNLIDTLPPAPTKNFTAAGPLLSKPQRMAEKRSVAFFNAPKAQTYKAPEAENGLFLDKRAVPNGDGTYTVTLEAYTTGKVVTEEVARPIDVILVLDYSDSMKKDFAGKSTGGWGQESKDSRLYAMKQAVSKFVDNVQAQYTPESNHRIAVVPFYGSIPDTLGLTYVTESGAKTIKNFVTNRGTGGMTEPGLAMERAETFLENDGREKVVILFTDGAPERSSGDKFNIDEADKAVASAKRMKDKKVTVYTVGIMNGANAAVVDNGNPNKDASWSDVTISFNRFLNYTSSNFPGATDVGLKGRYKITHSFTREHSSYYLTADNATALDAIFESISQQIGTPSIDLGPTTVVKDVMSQYFAAPENAQSVKFYTSDYNGTSFEKKRTPIDLTATIEGDAISVTGYDFNANFVSEKAKQDGTFGQKLIMEFTCSPKEGFLGGNGVPTNDPSSGIYVPGKQEPLRPFPEPHVDVPVVPITLDLPDGYVYYGGTVAQKKLNDLITVKAGDLELDLNAKKEGHFGLPPEDAWKADFIYLSTPTSHESFTNLKAPLTYTIEVTIKGSKSTTENQKVAEGEGHIRIITPQVAWKDSWIQGGKIPIYMTQNHVETKWLYRGEGVTGAAEIEPEFIVDTRSAPPALTFDYDPAPAAFGRDTPVKVTVSLGGDDITGITHFVHQDCPEDKNCQWGQPGFDDCQFIVHLSTFNLTITKQLANGANDAQDTFIFTVSSKDTGVNLQVSITGAGSVTIPGLPMGDYTVTESSGWSWDYTCPEPQPVTIQNGTAAVEFENIRNSVPLSGSAVANNHWKSTGTK